MTGITLDERGRPCPLPVIALGRALRSQPSGTLVTLMADDPAVRTDVPAWAAMVGATVLEMAQDPAGCVTVLVRLP